MGLPKATTAATQRWEENLSGLTSILHRIDKTATVYHSRARQRIMKTKGWDNLTDQEKTTLLDDAIAEVNKNREDKREKAIIEWKAKYGDESSSMANEDNVMDAPGFEDDAMGGKSKKHDEMHSKNEKESMSEESGYEDVSESYVSSSEAEEVNENESAEIEEAVAEDVVDLELHDRLLKMRRQQGETALALFNRLEAYAGSRLGRETPDDFEFGRK